YEMMIGSMYKKVNVVEQDPVEAHKWYTQAAEQGDSKALHWMAVSYLNGDGVAKDIGQAIQFYTKAADSGYALSQHNLPSAQRQLGAMRETGLGAQPDLMEAYRWYFQAAANGDPEAARLMTAL